jgi:hypothetical protein
MAHYAVDEQGRRGEFLDLTSHYDPRTRASYKDAKAAGAARWTEVYQLVPELTLAISANQPLYDNAHQLIGVLGVDLVLSDIGSFLSTLRIGKSGQAFLIERDQSLVASSTQENPFVRRVEDGSEERLNASDSQSEMIATTTQFLTEEFHGLTAIAQSQQLSFSVDGEQYFVQVTPIQDDMGNERLRRKRTEYHFATPHTRCVRLRSTAPVGRCA